MKETKELELFPCAGHGVALTKSAAQVYRIMLWWIAKNNYGVSRKRDKLQR